MDLLERISDAVWGTPMIILILTVGIYYSVSTRFIQLRGIGGMISALKQSFLGNAYSAFATALAATVGTGSVVGVGVALSLGGAGAIFWMWICGLFGMAVAFAEGVLSIKYRKPLKDGFSGGMMYVIRLGLNSKWLAWLYALCAALACLGMGIMTQTNSVAYSLDIGFGLPEGITAVALTLIIGICSACGSKRLSSLCSYLVPILALGYIILMLAVIIARIRYLPQVFGDIFSSAFGISPALGGFVGYRLKSALSQGIRRGVFSNEAGLGTTASLHAEAKGLTPKMQGHMNMLEVAIDTHIICTLTALAILSSGVSLDADGMSIVLNACQSVFGRWTLYPMSLAVALFALATAIGWISIGKGAYGYMTKSRGMWVYSLLITLSALLGVLLSLDGVILISDIFNGLMAIPCITALWWLRRDVTKEAKACR